MPLKPSQTRSSAVHLPLVRGAPDQRLTLSLFLRFWILLFIQAVFLIPLQCFLEYFVLRLFSPVVQEVGRPIYTHYLIKLVQAVYRRSTPAQLRILADRVRSYALVHSAPKFRGWLKKVEVNGTSGRWLAAPGTDRKKDDVVVYFIHGGGFIFDSGINSQDFFLSTIKALKDKHGLQASGFFLDYRLAPEYKYPSQLIETLAGYHYLVNTLGISEDKILIAGDSAGGNLASAFLLHLARPSPDVSVPSSLGPTPKKPAGALLISPYVNLYSNTSEFHANATYDLLSTSLIARAAFHYIGAEFPRDYRFRHPSSNPFRLLLSPQKLPNHEAEKLPGVYGWSDVKGIELFRSPYVQPSVQRDKKWWKEAMPGDGKTIVSWGGRELFSEDDAVFFDLLEKSGVKPVKHFHPERIHDFMLHDWALPTTWRTRRTGADADDFYLGRNLVVSLLKRISDEAKASQREAENKPEEAKSTARQDAKTTKLNGEAASIRQRAKQEAKSTPPPGPAPIADKPSPKAPTSYASIASHDEHIPSSAPVVAEGEHAKIKTLDEQAEEEAEKAKQPSTDGASYAHVAADSEHVKEDAPVVAEGEGATIHRKSEEEATTKTTPPPAASPVPEVSTDTPAPSQPAEPTSDLPTVSKATKKSKKKKGGKSSPTGQANGTDGFSSYAAIASHDDHVPQGAPVVAEGEGDVLKAHLENGSLAVEKA